MLTVAGAITQHVEQSFSGVTAAPQTQDKSKQNPFFSLFLFFLKEGIIIQPVKSAVTPGPIIASPRLAVSAQVSVHKLLSQRGAWPNVNTFLKVSIQ